MRYSAKSHHLWILGLFVVATAIVAWTPGQPVQSKSNISFTNSATTILPLVAPQAQDPSVYGSWGPAQSLGTYIDSVTSEIRPVVPIHINLLPDGRLLLWGRDKEKDNGFDIEGYTHAFVLDPFYMSLKPVKNNRTNLFCSGHSFLPDGRLIVTGGHSTVGGPAQEGAGARHTNIFDYRSDNWQSNPAPPDMNNGRWYPYNLTLSNGETLVVAGSYWGQQSNGQFTSLQNDVSQIFGLNGFWRDVVGLDAYHPGPGPILRNYPFLHLLPNDQPYIAGASSSAQAWFLTYGTANGAGEWLGGQPTNRVHQAGTSVQYDAGKIINVGGGSFTQTLNGYETIDLSNTSAFLPDVAWTPLATMGFPRVNHTGTLLPDGKVLVTGGSSCKGFNNFDCGLDGFGGAVNTPELWTPNVGWQQMANHQGPRGYHSTAILLPDARVMIGGGGLPAAAGERPTMSVTCVARDDREACRKFAHNDIEIFSPPYLFLSGGTLAPRPTITHAPSEVTYGHTFTVGVGTVRANDVSEAVLVRIGAVTHGFNQDQRRVRLNIVSRSADGLSLNIAAPIDGKVCPPGHYMLFLMKDNGQRMTPSVAKIIRVGKVSTAKSILAFSAFPETREVDVNAATDAANWTVLETEDSNNFITAFRTAAGKLSINVAANTGARRKGQLKIRFQNRPVFDHVIDIYQGKNFTDISTTSSTYTAASKLNAMLITNGCWDGTTYCPNNNLTRAEMAVLLDRAILGVDKSPPATTVETFKDVPATFWAHVFIEDIAKRGITAGCDLSGPNFCPNDTVTRAQLAVFLLRVLRVTPPNPPATTSFTDISTHWAYSFIEEAKQLGLMTECQQAGKFCPEQLATRAEVAEALVKMLRL